MLLVHSKGGLLNRFIEDVILKLTIGLQQIQFTLPDNHSVVHHFLLLHCSPVVCDFLVLLEGFSSATSEYSFVFVQYFSYSSSILLLFYSFPPCVLPPSSAVLCGDVTKLRELFSKPSRHLIPVTSALAAPGLQIQHITVAFCPKKRTKTVIYKTSRREKHFEAAAPNIENISKINLKMSAAGATFDLLC